MELNKIYHGDCLEIMPKIDNHSVDLIVCDLPYGVTNRNKWDKIIDLDKLWEQYKRIIKNNGVIVLTATQPFASKLIMSNLEMFKYEWVWIKNRTTNYLNAKKQPLRCNEYILVFYNKQCSFFPIPFGDLKYKHRSNKESEGTKNYGVHSIKTSVEIKKVTSAKNVLFFNTVHPDSKEYLNHPTQKPVELFKYLIRTYTQEGDVVLDNCIGSGTTAIACKQTNRIFIGIEKDKKFVDIANNRLKQEVLC